jgi:hypothetical protein
MITAYFQFLFDGRLDGKPVSKTFKTEQDKVAWFRQAQKDLKSDIRFRRDIQEIGDDTVTCGHCHGTGKVYRT